ncbi:MAG: EVE domain-containing protein [Bacillota bacterium]
MNYWLLKTEPKDYSWDDFQKEKKAVWDGVKGRLAWNKILEYGG